MPRPPGEVNSRKTCFAKLNEIVTARGGWIVSVPSATEVVAPNSTLPDDLIAIGYNVVPADPPEGQRILANAITQKLTLSSCGVFEALTEGSTKPVAEIRSHAGIVPVWRFAFTLA